jgi:hypothetical protein
MSECEHPVSYALLRRDKCSVVLTQNRTPVQVAIENQTYRVLSLMSQLLINLTCSRFLVPVITGVFNITEHPWVAWSRPVFSLAKFLEY